MIRSLGLAALAGALVSSHASAQNRESPFESAAASRFADSVLALMTLEEKLGQLSMAPGYGTQTGPQVSPGSQARIRAGTIGSYLLVFGAELTRDLQKIAIEESRLRIPLMFAADIIHGHRTIYPIPLAEAASFNPERVRQSARFAAVEATAHGLNWTFAPMVDIARDPRWGRISEGAGEDPYLGSVMAAAKVRGFQGGDTPDFSSPNAMLATAKHFAAYGSPEGGRDYNTVDVSERTLWEVHLPPFEAAVKAGVASLMPSFNDVGGVPTHTSDWLLGDVLRKRWGFKGFVISDWGAINELRKHGVAASQVEAGILALRAGVDVDMAQYIYADSLAPAVRAGVIPQAYVDSSARRVLRMKYALGLFRTPIGSAIPLDNAGTLSRLSTSPPRGRRPAKRSCCSRTTTRRSHSGRISARLPSSGRLPTTRPRRSETGPGTGAKRTPSQCLLESARRSRRRRGFFTRAELQSIP